MQSLPALPGVKIGIEDFAWILKQGCIHTVFNGLRVGDQFEYRSEMDKRVIIMQVTEILYDAVDGRPRLTKSWMNKMYTF